MNYCISDIHGEYDKYISLLEKIGFCEGDSLYVLGDVVDRGPRPVAVLRDMVRRKNVYPLVGNHDFMAYVILSRLNKEVTEESVDDLLGGEVLKSLAQWQSDGGDTTLKDFRALSPAEREELLDYIGGFLPYVELTLQDGRRFLLVHAGLGGYSSERDLEDYLLSDLCETRPELERVYYDEGLTVVVGHTPTISLCGRHEVYKSGNMIFIDCAATFGGRLACLCLETGEVVYE